MAYQVFNKADLLVGCEYHTLQGEEAALVHADRDLGRLVDGFLAWLQQCQLVPTE